MYEQANQVSDDGAMSPKPLYQEVADTLRAEISDGTYSADSQLPSEAELVDRFGVARGTVRAGLRVLLAEGLITSSQGRSYKVQSHEMFTLDASRFEDLQFSRPEDGDSYNNEVLHAGRVPRQDFRVEMVTMPTDVAARLDVPEGAPGVLRHCHRYVDDVPWSTQATYYPKWIIDECPRLAEPGDIEEGTTRYLADRGIKQTRFHDELSTRMPTPKEARSLEIGPGVPVLIWIRTGYTAKQPARCTVNTFRGDLNRLTYDLGDDHARDTEDDVH